MKQRRGLLFADVLKNAPPIQVFKLYPFESAQITILEPQKQDKKYAKQPYSNDYIEGCGTKKNPYRYISAAPVSPHYAIVDLWFRFHQSDYVYIKVNDWRLRVGPVGVTAENGYFTILFPD